MTLRLMSSLLVRRLAVGVCLLASMTTFAGCRADERNADRYEASASAKKYPLTGVVRAVKVGDESLSIAHESIDGLMDAMTMDFHVQDAWVLKAAAPGDRVSATLVLDGARSWLEGVAITKADSSGSAPSAGADVAAGTALPEVALTNQNGVAVGPSSYKGRRAVYTFIYTRCPLPDYCPLVMQRMNQLSERLTATRRRDDVWLVAVTLDPAYDTPPVLKAFGDRHITAADAGTRYDRWALLTGDPESIRRLATTFQLAYDGEGTEIVHGLRTVVVDAEGRVVRSFSGTGWTVEELERVLWGQV